VAVARAIACGARLLLFDEPMSALDTQTRRRVRDELKSVIDTLEVPAVLVTHDPVDALTLGQVISVMQGPSGDELQPRPAHICQTGTRHELLARPHDEFVAEFLGLNLLRGEARAGEEGVTEVSCGEYQFYSLQPASGPVFLTCHPSSVVLSHDRPAGSALNVMRGRVTSLSHLGAATRVALALEDRSGVVNGTLLIAEVSHLSERELDLREQQVVYASLKASATQVYPAGEAEV
jgi:molybdopterin-binding protein